MKRYIFLIAGLIGGDALTKYWAENFLDVPIILITNVLGLQYAQNTGIAFSFPITGVFLKILTVILILGIFWYYYSEEKNKKSTLLDMSYILIFAGALGNAWERILRGFVTDMIAVEHFAIFNLADSYITLGAIGIMYYYFKNT